METDRGIYLALSELARRHQAGGGSSRRGPLTEFELRGFSQHGEDGVIAEILSRIEARSQYFVEFGIETGREGNCVFLADVLGWRGLFVEPTEASYAALARKYAATRAVSTVNAAVTAENIERIFSEAEVPSEFDLLSIDVDGQDYWIWEALTNYRPRIVVIEYNAVLPAGRQLAQPRGDESPWDGTDYFGASLDALSALAARKEYRLVHTDLAAINAFFVRRDLAEDLFPPPEEVPRRHEPNYFMQGHRHPADARNREYTDLGEGHAAGSGQATTSWHPLDSRRLSSPAPDSATELAARTDFIWHQRFQLAPGVYTPGVSNVEFLMESAGIPDRLDDASVLDIGTTNGGAAFECERRGAKRVVAVDIADKNWFGFAAIKEYLRSQVDHVQASVYELPDVLGEQFDVVMFWGVLYHLRHPLLALDNVRMLTRGTVTIETAVCDHELAGADRTLPVARFYRSDELAGDSSNWFAPSMAALSDWCRSVGLEPTTVRGWPERAPHRALVAARVVPGDPEYMTLSYERPLRCSIASAHFE
jgi:SAM-dependent methyltransferase